MKKEGISLLKVFSLNEPELWKYSLTPADGLENLKNYIDRALKEKELKTSYPFVVLDKRTNKIAGSTRFYDYRKAHCTIQLGYTWYGKEFQGTGLNKNCKFLLLQCAFETMKLERVEYSADAKNAKSIGCVKQGILRSNCTAPKGRRDSMVLIFYEKSGFQNNKILETAYPPEQAVGVFRSPIYRGHFGCRDQKPKFYILPPQKLPKKAVPTFP
ncbi:RimJ/RimL family protein N-acetyltransferase [Gillisia sp. Hel_I_86]|uniref:GNAT family N-acetyltransferase n=1 Tax=Gillisia sp. Hel_I_86 TaxID=1249981 RepID=UPI00119A9824|nr:GNAT family N-acetyltransferase [Gillisia sp. Hel_I_86]TVZ28334.1 RimJ/RimL family protein N-acetyltransferase [Gillisia sp. Hel_I_86]